VRLWVNPSALFEWLHLEALGDCVLLWDLLISLGGCCHLDGLIQRGSSSGGWCLSPAPILVIVRGFWPFSDGEPKGILVDCLWLVWSSSCVGCAAPNCGLGVWCLLAREPPSDWIATTGLAYRQASEPWWKIIVSSCPEDFLVFIVNWLTLSCDWLIPWHGGITHYLSHVFTFLV
jgi:hypothetical protein